MEQKQINLQKVSDLELAKIAGQVFNELIKAQGNLNAIQREIKRRDEPQKESKKNN